MVEMHGVVNLTPYTLMRMANPFALPHNGIVLQPDGLHLHARWTSDPDVAASPF
jgi:hypothetical protein